MGTLDNTVSHVFRRKASQQILLRRLRSEAVDAVWFWSWIILNHYTVEADAVCQLRPVRSNSRRVVARSREVELLPTELTPVSNRVRLFAGKSFPRAPRSSPLFGFPNTSGLPA